MKKIIKSLCMTFVLLMMSFSIVACGSGEKNKETPKQIPEKISLASSVMLGEVEFENADTVKIQQDADKVKISGTISKMSASQKNAYGVESVDHVVCLKFVFDKERTLSKVKLKGEIVKVFSSDSTEENYVGSLTDLLDNEPSEDAYCYLILSAERKNYEITCEYSDETKSVVYVDIDATLANANENA